MSQTSKIFLVSLQFAERVNCLFPLQSVTKCKVKINRKQQTPVAYHSALHTCTEHDHPSDRSRVITKLFDKNHASTVECDIVVQEYLVRTFDTVSG